MTDAAAAVAAPAVEGFKSLKQLQTGRPVPGYTNDDRLLAEHAKVTAGAPRFRFPPEPNGYLHIGHAKAMALDFGAAKANGGFTYLRYDDTNPDGEEQEYIDAIEEMVRWMGWDPKWITYTSDYCQQLYDFAIVLIKKDKAYVDHSTQDEMRKQREERAESKWRNRPAEESLRELEKMRQGRYAEGEAMVRLKMDMKHDNPNMRDVVALRIKYSHHHRQGDKWCVYPTYDYSHCVVDSLEHIDYSLCTLEFETRRESYFWLLEALEIWRPHVWEFSRLNVTGSLLSKRKIKVLVAKKIVRGFDDPRLLTLAGMRRRGYTPEAINRFVDTVGITRSANVIQLQMLEQVLRETLDGRCLRAFGILSPVRVVVSNWKGTKTVDAPNHPAQPERGTRALAFSNEFYIDTSDFREEDAGPKYFGLAPGKTVGLKYNGNITCTSFDKDPATGKVSVIHCTIDFDRAVKPKTNIGWVDAATAVPCEFRCYDPLLTDDRAAIDPDFLRFIDANSETVFNGFVEASLGGAAVRHSVQLERVAYFAVDDDSGKNGKGLVLNRSVALKEDKSKN